MRGFNNGPVMDQVKPPDNLHDSLKRYRCLQKESTSPSLSEARTARQRNPAELLDQGVLSLYMPEATYPAMHGQSTAMSLPLCIPHCLHG